MIGTRTVRPVPITSLPDCAAELLPQIHIRPRLRGADGDDQRYARNEQDDTRGVRREKRR
jgi:hypothetical protein